MRANIDELDLQVQAFHAISGLGKVGKQILEREKFIELSLKSIEKHRQSAELVSAAWHSLGALANSGLNFGTYKNNLLFLIFESMKTFFTKTSFQITACFALAHIFFNNSKYI
jgi:hypothetical protein